MKKVRVKGYKQMACDICGNEDEVNAGCTKLTCSDCFQKQYEEWVETKIREQENGQEDEKPSRKKK